MALSTIGTDPDYASLLGQRHDPRLLMAQKLMDVGAMPTNNSTQSSFWANLLNQGARGALGGYLYQGVQKDREKEATAQATEAAEFNRTLAAGPPGGSSPKGGGDAAPAAPAPAPGPRASLGGGDGSAGGDLVAAVHHLESRSRMAPGIMGDGGAAAGPMQVHAGALADVNRAQGTNYTHEQLAANPELGLKVGAAYLAQLRQQFGRDDYALGAYNAGPGAMRAAIASGKGVAGLPARTQQYVTEGLSRMQGRQADASPPPGSNIDALMAGVNQPKPRGIQLAENLFPGTATDAPTPILPDMGDAQGTAVPRVPVASAALDAPGAAAPAMRSPAAASVPGANLELPAPPDAAALPLPSPAVVPPPAAAPSPPPDLMPGAGPAPAIVPAPDAASVPTPDLANAAPVPAIVPQPDAAAVPQPPPALVPDNPMSRADPASLAAFNGAPPAPTPAVVPPPDPAIVPPPAPAMVPRPGAATLPPVQGPPVPPELLARKLQQAAPDNATEALNTASLAAARRGETFVPGAGPTGPQLAAPLMSWAGNLTAAGAPLLTPAGGPTGPQLAAPLQPPGAPGAASQQGGPVPLVTPASGPGDATGATTDTSATGGQSKGASPSAPAPAASTADAQANADWYLKMARQAAGSSNPKIRAQAGVLEAQGQALQRRIDRQDALDQQLGARRDARETAAANRNLPIHDLTLADGKVHSVQIMPDGSQRDLGLSGNQHAQAERNPQHITVKVDGKNYVHTWNPGTGKYENTGLLAEKQDSEGGGRYPGKDATSTDLNILDTLHDTIASGNAKEDEKREYSRAYNRLQNGADYDAPDPQHPGQSIRVPGHPTDLTGYAPPPYRDTTPKPGKAPTEGERVAAGFANRMAEANKTLEEKGTQTFGDVMAGRVPMVGNYLTSDQGQQFQTAARAWIWAKLRKESGAAVPPEEAKQEFETYFPQPGDTPARIALKKRLRDLETQNMQRDAGNAYTPPSDGGGGPVRISSDAEFDKLQPGQQFIGPDGKTRTK